jgi:hypothetical protein
MVTNTADSGAGSLRQAITDANANAGADTINFAIGTGPQTISLLSVLPAISEAVIIDGTTQPAFAGVPIIELDGTNVGGAAFGLNIIGGSTTVKGLIINRFNRDGIRIFSQGGNTITGNYIGTNAAGTAAAANGTNGIEIQSSPNNTIGGLTASTRNVISGNTQNGVLISSTLAGNLVQGNFIGTKVTGTAALPNGAAGVAISGNLVMIGGASAGARNIIAGNGAEGILITGAQETIQGNFIGTDVSGTARLGNGSSGISTSISTGNVIGGTAAGVGNLISGNIGANSYGISMSNTSNTQIQGNLIGTNAAGTAPISNDAGGIILLGGANITIGGNTASARNLISGNGGGGILILSDGAMVQGNYIGTNAAGTAAVANGSEGVLINGGDNSTIGGTSAGAGNLISGNSGGGIIIAFSADNNVVQGNLIGTDAAGTGALANGTGYAGIAIEGTSINNTIGGTAAGAGNLIAFNDGGGIGVQDGTGNAILGNSIYSNRFGIDLAPGEVTPNDACDGDSGANQLQNFPVLTSASAGATNTTVTGTLNSTANTTFRVEFFSSATCSILGNGEGKTFLGFQNVTTDGSCNANLNFVVPNASVPGSIITATATDSSNNTSEFSACTLQTTVNAVFQFSTANYNAGEADGSVTITVNRTGATGGSSLIDFSTGNNEYRACTPGDPQNLTGVATQNCDFIRTQGTITFNQGDTSKTFTVLISDDGHVEGNEAFPITLSSPVGGTVGAIGATTVTITDNDTALVTSPASFRFAGSMTGAQETPTNNSNGTGLGFVLLSQDQAAANAGLMWKNLTSAQTVQHVHGSAPPGTAAPILFTLPNGTPVPNAALNGITAQQISDLKAGLLYVNTHTNNFPAGEIRGQLLWNPTLEENFFVNQHYYDFLQRQPDPGGFSFWIGQISFCGADPTCLHNQTIVVSNAFFYEQEYQQTGAYVYRIFRAAFGNNQPLPNPDNSNLTESKKIPSYDSYAALRARVVGGANLSAGQQDAANLFVTSPQFLAKYPANLPMDQFVDAVLSTILTDIGVNLTAQRTTLIGLPNRGAVLYRLANDDLQGGNGGFNNRAFIDAEYNRAFVITQYFGYLRRDGDIGGILFWLGQVNSAPLRDTSKQNAMVCSFITSGEYQLRFGPKIPRTNQECQ